MKERRRFTITDRATGRDYVYTRNSRFSSAPTARAMKGTHERYSTEFDIEIDLDQLISAICGAAAQNRTGIATKFHGAIKARVVGEPDELSPKEVDYPLEDGEEFVMCESPGCNCIAARRYSKTPDRGAWERAHEWGYTCVDHYPEKS